MTKISNIPHDHYDKKIPIHKEPGLGKDIATNAKKLQPSYKISNLIKTHITDSATKNTNQSIKFEDIRVSINTHRQTLSMRLSYLINNQFLNPETTRNFNHKIDVHINLARFHQHDGEFENLEAELTQAINKISRSFLNFVQKKSGTPEKVVITSNLLNELLIHNEKQILGPLSTIISIVHAKGKYKNHPPEVNLYNKQINGQKNHIPGFEIERKDLDMQVNVYNAPYFHTVEEEKASPNTLERLFKFNLLEIIYTALQQLWKKIVHNRLFDNLKKQMRASEIYTVSDQVSENRRNNLRTTLLLIIIIILLILLIFK